MKRNDGEMASEGRPDVQFRNPLRAGITRGWFTATLLAVTCQLAAPALAQSTAKELFVGLDGSSTQLGAINTPGPAKPVKPKVLGLQTTIFRLFNDGGTKAVSPATVFAAGDRIRLGFNANRSGFLYILNLGTSGRVTTIFPATAADNNQVRPGLVYQIPQQAGKSIKFDTTPGEEVILVVLAETRISEFDYGGQQIVLNDPQLPATGKLEPRANQRVVMASLDTGSTSKDLFVEDDGVFQTAVFHPTSEAVAKKKPLVTAIRLVHR